MPLLTSETLTRLCDVHDASADAVTMITASLDDPTGYGRIVRGPDGAVAAIVEQKDATEEQRAIHEVNSGIYAFDLEFLRDALVEVGTDNAQARSTSPTSSASARRGLGDAHLLDDLWQTEGVNKVQLARLGAELNRRTVEQARRRAIVIDPATTGSTRTSPIGPAR